MEAENPPLSVACTSTELAVVCLLRSAYNAMCASARTTRMTALPAGTASSLPLHMETCTCMEVMMGDTHSDR